MRPFACIQLLVAKFSRLPVVISFQVLSIPKLAAHDTKFTTTDNSNSPKHVQIPADTPIVWNVPGLHYNGKFFFLINSFHRSDSHILQKNIGTNRCNSDPKGSSKGITIGMLSSHFPLVRELVSVEGLSTSTYTPTKSLLITIYFVDLPN